MWTQRHREAGVSYIELGAGGDSQDIKYGLRVLASIPPEKRVVFGQTIGEGVDALLLCMVRDVPGKQEHLETRVCRKEIVDLYRLRVRTAQEYMGRHALPDSDPGGQLLVSGGYD